MLIIHFQTVPNIHYDRQSLDTEHVPDLFYIMDNGVGHKNFTKMLSYIVTHFINSWFGREKPIIFHDS